MADLPGGKPIGAASLLLLSLHRFIALANANLVAVDDGPTASEPGVATVLQFPELNTSVGGTSMGPGSCIDVDGGVRLDMFGDFASGDQTAGEEPTGERSARVRAPGVSATTELS